MELIQHTREITEGMASIEEAKQAIREELKSSRSYKTAFMAWAVDAAAAQLVYRQRSASRQAARRPNTPTIPASAHAKSAKRVFSAFLDTYPIGDKFLGDCCRADLIASAESKESDAAGKLNAARFERLVASRLKDDKQVVRKALKESEIRRLNTEVSQTYFATQSPHARPTTPTVQIAGVA